MKQHVLSSKVLLVIFFLSACSLHSFSQGTLQAVNDTFDLYPGVPRVYDILANDTIPATDTVKSLSWGGDGSVRITWVHDLSWKWTITFCAVKLGNPPEIQYLYVVHTMSHGTSSAKIVFRIHDKSYSYIDINNVRARFNAWGNHFYHENCEYEVPKGSGKTSIFNNAFWIGGKDAQGNLHLAAERYEQGASGNAGTCHDFYIGPVMDSAKYSIYQDTVWQYIWNLKKTDIDYHRAHFWENGYKPIHDILTWPGNGDVSLGQAPKLAPFSDRNADGIYDPFDGDYPEIRGDQALFFIFNDDRGIHAETTGAKLRVEIHGMAYAYDMPEDSALNNAVFLNYRLFNRSNNTYDSTLMGVFTDIDLGYANDDYLGCDVERSLYYAYNGTPIDGTGQPYAYGANPPVQSVSILAGPYMDPDGIDNPKYGQNGQRLCGFSVNGSNFGDSIVDNERYGLQRFMYINNSNSGVPQYMTDPIYAIDYYNLMSGRWKDGTPVIYGGNAHPSWGGYGPACRFMYPGESDSLNWGAGCAPPNGPVNWTETTAGNAPQDRRGLGVTGPVTFKPGDVQDIDICFGWARDYTSPEPDASVSKMRLMSDKINKAFATNRLPNGELIYGISDHNKSSEINIRTYPNPASDHLTVDFGNEVPLGKTTMELLTTEGTCIRTFNFVQAASRNQVVVADIPAGFYFLRVTTHGVPVVKKVVVIH